jgi:hypothetical protein
MHTPSTPSFRSEMVFVLLLILFSAIAVYFIDDFEQEQEFETLEILKSLDQLNRIDLELNTLLAKRMSPINYDKIILAEKDFERHLEILEKYSQSMELNSLRYENFISIKENFIKKLKLFEKFKSYNSHLLNYVSYFYNWYGEMDSWHIADKSRSEIDRLLFSTLKKFITLSREDQNFIDNFHKINKLLSEYPDQLHIQKKTSKLVFQIKEMQKTTVKFEKIVEEIEEIYIQREIYNYRKCLYDDLKQNRAIYKYALFVTQILIFLILFRFFNWRNKIKNEFE